MQMTTPQESECALSLRYNRIKEELISQKPNEDILNTYTHERLFEPNQWLEAFLLWEYAWKQGWDKTKTVGFFRRIFFDYDVNFMFELDEAEYDWFWNQLTTLLDAFGEYHPEGWLQLSSQYTVAREGYKNKEKEFFYLEKACATGHERSLIIYGKLLYCGIGIPQNKEKAEELFSQVKTQSGLEYLQLTRAYIALQESNHEAAAQIAAGLETVDLSDCNDPELYYAYPYLDLDYLLGYIAEWEKRYEEAKEYYIKRISCVPLSVIYARLGYLYQNKLVENPEDTPEILALFERAFKLEPRSQHAQHLYTTYYESGTEWQDNEKAIYFLKKGVQYGVGYCAYKLSLILLKNEQYKDIEKGLQYLDQAMALGCYDAYLTKGVFYRDGDILEKDIPKYVQLVKEALELGCNFAWVHLGYIYEKGMMDDNTPDLTKALEHYQTGADKGQLEGCDRTGEFYRNGYGTEKDPVKAREYYQKAIALGSDYARVELGIMCTDGEGEEPDYEKAVALFSEAAANNYSPGHYFMGLAYKRCWSVAENPEKAFEHFQVSANNGHIWAHAELALCYDQGYGVERDRTKALEKLLWAAERDLFFAQYKIGEFYLYGNDQLAANYDEALRWLTMAAENGYSYAFLELGNYYGYLQKNEAGEQRPDYVKALDYYQQAADREVPEGCEKAAQYYRNGYGTEKDPVKAREYYQKSISLGSNFSRVELGVMCINGEGENPDHEKAVTLFSEAAANNYIPGHYFMGLAYKRKWSVPENPDKAIKHFQIAANAGHAMAETEMGLCYDQAYGVEKDRAKALEYMLLAAGKNIPFAQYKAGEYYMYGNNQVASNYDEALRWLTLAANNNYIYAFLELGNYYFYRYNQTNEPEKSYEFYEKAARGGYINEGLGLCLQMGTGVEKNEGEGFKYLLKGAEDGYIRAMYYTGRSYMYGIGIQENHEEAFRWYSQAAGYRHVAATYLKGRMLVEGDGTPPNIEEGIECVQRAAESGNRDAMYELANYYLLGKGVPADDDIAWDWFEKAAAKGHKESMKITGKSQRK